MKQIKQILPVCAINKLRVKQVLLMFFICEQLVITDKGNLC